MSKPRLAFPESTYLAIAESFGDLISRYDTFYGTLSTRPRQKA